MTMNLSKTKKLTLSGIFIGLAVLVEFIHFPLIPSAPFLEYDAAGVILLIGGFLLGPYIGASLGIITAGLHVLIGGGNSGFYGFLMNAIALAIFVFVSIFLFQKLKNIVNENISLIASAIIGILITTAIMIPANLIFTPLFLGQPISLVKGMLLVAIVPFNLLKWTINAIIGGCIYKILINTKVLEKIFQ